MSADQSLIDRALAWMEWLRRLRYRRIDWTKSDFGVTELKRQFKIEAEQLSKTLPPAEIAARNRAILGIPPGAKGRLVGVGGKLFKDDEQSQKSR